MDTNNIVVQHYLRKRMEVDVVEKELNESTSPNNNFLEKQKYKEALKELNKTEE